MIRILSICLLWVLTVVITYAQNISASQVQFVAWGQGVEVAKYPEGRFSVLGMAKIPDGIAYLSLPEEALLMFDKTGEKIRQINLGFKPIDFAYANHTFYVMDFKQVRAYTLKGELMHKYELPQELTAPMGIYTIDNRVYVYDASDNTYVFDGDSGWQKRIGKLISTADGSLMVQAIRKSDRFYIIDCSATDNNCSSYSYASDWPLGAILIHGMVDDYLVIEVEELTRQAPLQVQRQLKFIDVESGAIAHTVTIPPQRYTYIPFDIAVEDGNVLLLLAAIEGLYTYKLAIQSAGEPKLFPAKFYQKPVHFNE